MEIRLAFKNLEIRLYKIAISLPELVQQSNLFSRKYRPGCVAKLEKSRPKDLYLQYRVVCHKKDSDPNGHEVRVHFDVSKVLETKKAKDLDIRVSCSCPAELYWGSQWNLHQRDALEGEPRPKLIPPTERLDLRGHYIICKHIHTVLERILPSIQHNINNILRSIEVDKNKPNLPPTPERQKKKEDELKNKLYLKRLRDRKNKQIQKKLLEGLRKREEQRLQRENEKAEELGEKGDHLVNRTQPAVPATKLPEPSEPMPKKETTPSEDKKKPSLLKKKHKGLPYKPAEPLDQENIPEEPSEEEDS